MAEDEKDKKGGNSGTDELMLLHRESRDIQYDIPAKVTFSFIISSLPDIKNGMSTKSSYLFRKWKPTKCSLT